MTRKKPRQRADVARAASGSRASALRPPTKLDTPERLLPAWKWRTFPVLCAFVTGMLIAFLANAPTSNPLAFVLLIAALLGFGYCIAHLLVTNFLVAGRIRARRASIARGEEQPGDYEEELVYPGGEEDGR